MAPQRGSGSGGAKAPSAPKAKKASASSRVNGSVATGKPKSVPRKTKASDAPAEDLKAKTAAQQTRLASRGRSSKTAEKPLTNGVASKQHDVSEEEDHMMPNGETKPSSKGAKSANGEKSNTSKKRRATSPAPAASNTSKKVKTDSSSQAKATKATKTIKAAKATEPIPPINQRPTKKLNIFVFGESTSGENGLGTAKNAVDVKRPRLNANLLPQNVGVVAIATGGMHSVALTHDNKILTWGVNDQGALGRNTDWDGGLKDMDEDNGSDDSDSDDASDSGMNPHEATPTAIPADAFPEDVIFTAVAAADSMSLALTQDGQVYAWGTFRSNDGILGFDPKTSVQRTPKLLSELKNIKSIVCGANHILALDKDGKLYSWGAGEQYQLGRRVVERNMKNMLKPTTYLFKRNPIASIGAGEYHSFAIDTKGRVFGWGLNSFAETGVIDDDESKTYPEIVSAPTEIEALTDANIVEITGGSHHSIAATKDHKCLVWGRVDGAQSGLSPEALEKSPAVVRDERGSVRLLSAPTQVPDIEAVKVAAGSDTSMAIDETGRAWTWGFSANYQTGQGTDDDVEVATAIDNTATRGKKLIWGGLGGQFGVLAEVATEDSGKVNGTA